MPSISIKALPAMPCKSPYMPAVASITPRICSSLFALRPKTRHGFALPVQIILHVGKFLNDGFKALAKARAGQILIHDFHLRVLTHAGLPHSGDFDQRLS